MTKKRVILAPKSILKPTLKLPSKTVSLKDMRKKIGVCINAVIYDGHKYDFNPVLGLYELEKKVYSVHKYIDTNSTVYFGILKPNQVPNGLQKYIVGEELSMKLSFKQYTHMITSMEAKYCENDESNEKHIRVKVDEVEEKFIYWTDLVASAKTHGLVS